MGYGVESGVLQKFCEMVLKMVFSVKCSKKCVAILSWMIFSEIKKSRPNQIQISAVLKILSVNHR